MTFDFIYDSSYRFTLYQIKGYHASKIVIDQEATEKLINRERKGLTLLDDCEGAICNFADDT